MTAAITSRLEESTDALLRFAMRADAVLSGLAGVAGLPLAGWLAELSGTTTTTEYAMAAFFIGYGVVVFGLATLPKVATAGTVVIAANLLYTVCGGGDRRHRCVDADDGRRGPDAGHRHLHAGLRRTAVPGVASAATERGLATTATRTRPDPCGPGDVVPV